MCQVNVPFLFFGYSEGWRGWFWTVQSGWGRVQLQKFKNKNYKNDLRFGVNCAIIESNKEAWSWVPAPPRSAIGRERVRPTYAGSVKHSFVDHARNHNKWEGNWTMCDAKGFIVLSVGKNYRDMYHIEVTIIFAKVPGRLLCRMRRLR